MNNGFPCWLGIHHGKYPVKNPAAAAAKSLQSCLALCDPIDGSPHESRQIGSGQIGDGKSAPRHSRNQRTKMD